MRLPMTTNVIGGDFKRRCERFVHSVLIFSHSLMKGRDFMNRMHIIMAVLIQMYWLLRNGFVIWLLDRKQYFI